jgi:hypothetical protein
VKGMMKKDKLTSIRVKLCITSLNPHFAGI